MEPVSKWKLTGKLTGEKGDELSGNLNTRYIGLSRGSGFNEYLSQPRGHFQMTELCVVLCLLITSTAKFNQISNLGRLEAIVYGYTFIMACGFENLALLNASCSKSLRYFQHNYESHRSFSLFHLTASYFLIQIICNNNSHKRET